MEANNMAALREALVKIRRDLNDYCNDCTLLDRMTEDPPDYTCLRDSLLKIERIVDSALAAPARNCDVYDAKTAEKEFVRQTGSKSIRRKSVRWLYALANGGNSDGKLLKEIT